MAVSLVTGYRGRAHVTAAEQALFNAGICGTEKYVMQTGEKFACTINSANRITIGSGDLVNQGRHINVPTNTSVPLEISNGRSGYHRIDVVSMRYTKDSSTAVESADLIVIEGTNTLVSTPAAPPELVSGNIFNGDLIDDFPLYYIYIEGLSIERVEPKFKEINPIGELWRMVYPIGSVFMNFEGIDPNVIFGGTWVKIENRFLLGAGNFGAKATGGASTVQLGPQNMPAHAHTMDQHTHGATIHNAGAHTHSQNYKADTKANTGSGWRICGATDYNGQMDVGWAGEHNHGISIHNEGPTSTHSAGGNAPVNIMPPYIAINIWQRTE